MYICLLLFFYIGKILPISGPVNGGTVVTLQGQNMIEDIINTSVYLEGSRCIDLNSKTKKYVS